MPWFLPTPGETDTLMVVTAVILLVSVVMFGVLFLTLHTLPERIAHKSHKLQFEIVAVLGLLALFTHMHVFWVAGLLLALIDFPDFPGWFGKIAGSVEKIAENSTRTGAPSEAAPEIKQAKGEAKIPPEAIASNKHGDGTASTRPELTVTTTRG
jgi:multisubunit Na+/H+ antiporter MnhF subunit